jgi:hypothetical protein
MSGPVGRAAAGRGVSHLLLARSAISQVSGDSGPGNEAGMGMCSGGPNYE